MNIFRSLFLVILMGACSSDERVREEDKEMQEEEDSRTGNNFIQHHPEL